MLPVIAVDFGGTNIRAALFPSELPKPSFQTKSKLPRSKLRGIHSGTTVMGAAAPKPLLAHSSRQQADGYSGNINKSKGNRGFSQVLQQLVDKVRSFLPSNPDRLRIGIASPGMLDRERGVILCAVNLPGWENTLPREEIFHPSFLCGSQNLLAQLGDDAGPIGAMALARQH